MAKRTGPTNIQMRQLIVKLKKAAKANQSKIWEDVAEDLSKPRRQKVEVNLIDVERNTEKGDTIVVPGKVLGKGEITKSVTIAAWSFSADAKEKIKKAGGKELSIEELLDKNPKGSKIKIMV